MSAEAGWYPDPASTAPRFRWWDGAAWSRWLSESSSSPAPAATGAPPAARTVGAAAAVAMVVGVVLLAVAVVGGTVALTSPVVGTGPAVAPPARTGAPYLVWEYPTRQATAQTLSITLPGEPWLCPTQADDTGAYQSFVRCTTIVHENYRGNSDWSAEAAVGLLDPSSPTASAGSLKEIGERVVSAIRASAYSGVDTELVDYISGPTPYGPADRVLLLRAMVTYRLPGLASTRDELQVLIVKLPSGAHAVYYSAKPLDAEPEVTAALRTTAESLQLR